MLSLSHKHHYPMCHAVATAAPAVHCNGIQPYRGAACQEGRLLLLSSRRVINYLALCIHVTSLLKFCLYDCTSLKCTFHHITHVIFHVLQQILPDPQSTNELLQCLMRERNPSALGQRFGCTYISTKRKHFSGYKSLKRNLSSRGESSEQLETVL